MKLFIIDNYDSFTFNLYQMLQPLLDEPITVVRNDAISFDDLCAAGPSHVVLHPDRDIPV